MLPQILNGPLDVLECVEGRLTITIRGSIESLQRSLDVEPELKHCRARWKMTRRAIVVVYVVDEAQRIVVQLAHHFLGPVVQRASVRRRRFGFLGLRGRPV